MGFHALLHRRHVDPHRLYVLLHVFYPCIKSSLISVLLDDATAHISEEVSSAARTAPLAILIGVLATETLGFFLLIAASFASPNVTRIVDSNLTLPMGQVYLDTLGKKGMLAIWSLCILVQVRL